MLTYGLLITSILFLIGTIHSNILICSYLRNKKDFLHFFLDFVNLVSALNFFKKRMTLIADVFLNFRLRKTWLDKCVKSPVPKDPSTSNMVNGLKHCSKLNDSTFTIFIDNYAGNSGLKSLSE